MEYSTREVTSQQGIGDRDRRENQMYVELFFTEAGYSSITHVRRKILD